MADSLIDFTNIRNPFTQSSSSSGLPSGPVRTQLQGNIGQLGSSIPSWQQSLGKVSQLPGQIDSWANERIKHQTLGADDFSNSLGAVARQRAGAGIFGGTETQNLRSGVLGQLIDSVLGRRDAIRNQANQMKASTIMGTPQLMAQPVQAMGGLAQLLSQSQSQAYQEDPSAWGDIISRLIMAGYTG